MEKKGLNFIGVALMYVGTIMGAGFASGREIWQFFGVFGKKGLIGIFFVGFLFIIIGIMTSMIALKLKTNNMGRVIVPAGNDKLISFVGYFMAFILLTVLITMTAAGGALVNQEYGINRIIGGVAITFLVIITLLGGFDRVSHVFKYLMPILVVVVVTLCISVIFSDIVPSNLDIEIKPSPLSKHYMLSPFIYVSYNILAVIPIVATAAVSAKSSKHAIWGSALGGLFLGILALVLALAMLKDPTYSHSMDMPMLAYSNRINQFINITYSLVLMFAIYASASGNYYGFTTKLKDNKNKKKKIVFFAILSFVFGLIGFKNIVAYMFPVEGFLGFIIVGLLCINFYRVVVKGKKQVKNQ